MKSRIIFLLIILSFYLSIIKSQTTILIYHEDFENGAPGVTLNTIGPGSIYGSNQWVINNKYTGAPLYPNTPDQKQTSSGTISMAPYSHYLHIYDKNADLNSGVSSCNYNPTDSSDRFVQFTYGNEGFCTLGIKNVKLAFFYTGEGSPTAYAELYYSADQGPWIKTGTIYNNQSIWKYELVQNPAFDNKVNLRFGIRWVNKAGSMPGNTSFGIDDIFIKGDFDNFVTNFNLVIDSVTPSPVCQNFAVSIYYHLTAPICGAGFCQIQLSDAAGSFAKPTEIGLFQINNQVMSGKLSPTIPSSTPPGTCYKIRIQYYFVYYGLDFFTTASICFEVKHCLNTITTLKALVIRKEDSLCVGSVIEVPFFSTGVFQKGNKYIAQLSDSVGNFSSNLNIIGTSPDNNTYDPAQGSLPGSVGGMITEKNQPIPNGCNYYIRVVSTDPATIGEIYGPFCIKHCDIETNKKTDIQACVHSCSVGPEGFNTTVYIKIHDHDTTAVYDPSNQFKIELHEPMFFGIVSSGLLGKVTAINDTTLKVHIPCADSLAYAGLSPGLYYMRIVATNSNHPMNMNGTLIHLVVGAPADKVTIVQYPEDSVLCVGDVVYFYPVPYNTSPPMNSTYQWYLNGKLFLSNPSIGILFNSAGTFNLTIQETNNGCKGPVTPNSTKLYVLGAPNLSIKGPNQVCLGDTFHYNVAFQNGVYYEWKSSGGKIIDTSNNELNIRFDTAGVFVVNILGLNKCGQATGKKNILVTAHPDADFSVVSPICSSEKSIIKATGTSTPPLIYSWNFDGGIADPGGNNAGPQKVYWKTAGNHKVKLTVTKYGCATIDSNIVNVLQSPKSSFNFVNQCLGTTSMFVSNSQGFPDSWFWDFGDGGPTSTLSNPTHLYSDTGSYQVKLIVRAPNGCTDTLVKPFKIYSIPTSVFESKSPICNGESSDVVYKGNAPSDATYTWNFTNGTIISGEGKGPYKVAWPGLGSYKILLSVSKNGCSSETSDSINVKNCVVIIPDIFTPNKDGENETFFMKGLDSFHDSRLLIYNRWGNKIYESNDYHNDWNGENYPDGVYFYVLFLNTGESMNGTVTIVR